MNKNALKFLSLVSMSVLLLITILLAVTFSGAVNPGSIVIFSFVTVIFEYPFIIPACLIFLPSLLWKQSMFLGYSLMLGLLLSAPLVQVIYQSYIGYSHGGLGEALGLFVILILACSYLLGLVIRASVHSVIKSKQLENKNEKTA